MLIQTASEWIVDPMTSIKTVTVGSIEEIISAAIEFFKTMQDGTPVWYRGIKSHIRHKLVPGLLRDDKDINQIFDRETRLLTRFRQRSLAYWPSGYPQDDWEHLFAMQHYGAPTRLLDWSENIFVAIFFALQPPVDSSADDLPAIWCFDPVRWNRKTPALSEFGDQIRILTTTDEEIESYRPQTRKKRQKSPVAIYGTHNSERVVAQRGTFTVWGNDSRCLEDIAGEQGTEPLLRILIHGNRDSLFRILQNLGFGETMIFPELSYLAEELKRSEGWR